MRAKLESIAQSLAREIETTGTITIDGKPTSRYSITSNSPYAGFCRPSIDKLGELVKETFPESKINVLNFIRAGQEIWDSTRHVIAEVIKDDENYWVDPTIGQYIPGIKMVYSEEEDYPIPMVKGSFRRIPYAS